MYIRIYVYICIYVYMYICIYVFLERIGVHLDAPSSGDNPAACDAEDSAR